MNTAQRPKVPKVPKVPKGEACSRGNAAAGYCKVGSETVNTLQHKSFHTGQPLSQSTMTWGTGLMASTLQRNGRYKQLAAAHIQANTQNILLPHQPAMTCPVCPTPRTSSSTSIVQPLLRRFGCCLGVAWCWHLHPSLRLCRGGGVCCCCCCCCCCCFSSCSSRLVFFASSSAFSFFTRDFSDFNL